MKILKFFWESIKDIFSFNYEVYVEIIAIEQNVVFAKELTNGRIGYFFANDNDGDPLFIPEIGQKFTCCRGYSQLATSYHASAGGTFRAKLLYQKADIWLAEISQDAQVIDYTFVYSVGKGAAVGSVCSVVEGSYVKVPSFCYNY